MGANPNYKNKRGQTPLDLLVGTGDAQQAAVAVLLAAGANGEPRHFETSNSSTASTQRTEPKISDLEREIQALRTENAELRQFISNITSMVENFNG